MLRACGLVAVLVYGCRDPREPPLRPMARAPVRDGGAPSLSDADISARLGAGAGASLERVTTWAPLDVVLVRARQGGRWTAWAVDANAAQTGLAGAERVLRGWSRIGYEPFTEDLARVLGLFAFPASRVIAQRDVVETDAGPVLVAAPSLAPDGRGSRALSFTHRDESGALRLARFVLGPRGEVRAVTTSLTPPVGATDNPPR